MNGENNVIKMTADAYAQIMRMAGSIVSEDPTRTALLRIELYAEGGRCIATAIDGYVMAQTTVDCSGEGTFLVEHCKFRIYDGEVTIERDDEMVAEFFEEEDKRYARYRALDDSDRFGWIDWPKLPCVQMAKEKPICRMLMSKRLLERALDAIDSANVLIEFHRADQPLVLRGAKAISLALPERSSEEMMDRRYIFATKGGMHDENTHRAEPAADVAAEETSAGVAAEPDKHDVCEDEGGLRE